MNKTEVSQKLQKKPATHRLENIVQLIVFHLGDEEFAANIVQVREIIWRALVTPIPDSPDFITRIDRRYINGVLTLGNRLIMLLDLEKVLSEGELIKLSEIQVKHRSAIESAQEKVAVAVREEHEMPKSTKSAEDKAQESEIR